MKYFAASAVCGSVNGNAWYAPSRTIDAPACRRRGAGDADGHRAPPLKRDDLGPRRVGRGVKVKLELPLPFGEQAAQDDLERRSPLELVRDVLDREQVRERVLALGARTAALAKQTPLLQIAQMILADGRDRGCGCPGDRTARRDADEG